MHLSVVDEIKKHKLRSIKTALACLGFACIGLQAGVIGPSLLDLRILVSCDFTQITYMVTGRSVGYAIGSITAGLIAPRTNPQMVLCLTLLVSAMFHFAMPITKALNLMLVLITLTGIVNGMSDTRANEIQLLVERFREELKSPDINKNVKNDITTLLTVLQCPVFASILSIQESLEELKDQLSKHPSILPVDFDISTTTGELLINIPPEVHQDVIAGTTNDNLIEADYENAQNVRRQQLELIQQEQLKLKQEGLKLKQEEVCSNPYPDLIPPPLLTDQGQSAAQQSVKQSIQMVISTEWAQIQSVDLINEGNGLGFGIVGGRSTGVIIKTVLPGGAAAKDGRMKVGDHILQIGDVNLRGMGSEQVAQVLRNQGLNSVKLILARPIQELPSGPVQPSLAPIVPTRIISDVNETQRQLAIAKAAFTSANELHQPGAVGITAPPPAGFADEHSTSSTCINRLQGVAPQGVSSVKISVNSTSTVPSSHSTGTSLGTSGTSVKKNPAAREDLSFVPTAREDLNFVPTARDDLSIILPAGGSDQESFLYGSDETTQAEMETFQVELVKDQQGLGITIAGYVCEKEEISGIFVKSIARGSAADVSQKIQVNDQIIEVDGRSLYGYTNHEAVEVLRSAGKVVKLRLARYLRGSKFEQLQQAIASTDISALRRSPIQCGEEESDRNRSTGIQSSLVEPGSASHDTKRKGVGSLEVRSSRREEEEAGHEGVTLMEILPPPPEYLLQNEWTQRMGNEFVVVVANIKKFRESGGLGISLEGTVDIEDGQEVRPHHYIRAILSDGPVGAEGTLQPGDEILQVNGKVLVNMNHIQVVALLKDLPIDVEMVCARQKNPLSLTEPQLLPDHTTNTATMLDCPPISANEAISRSTKIVSSTPGSPEWITQERPGLEGGKSSLPKRPGLEGGKNTVQKKESEGGDSTAPSSSAALDRLVKAKSDGSLSVAGISSSLLHYHQALSEESSRISRSLEPLTGLAMWSSETQVIELLKTERGLGFSILDYQDPMNPAETVIVIRSLVPGGVAQQDGTLIPGDRLVYVNDVHLENATLDQAVAALKGAPKGIVRIGVAKPLPLPDSSPPTPHHSHF